MNPILILIIVLLLGGTAGCGNIDSVKTTTVAPADDDDPFAGVVKPIMGPR